MIQCQHIFLLLSKTFFLLKVDIKNIGLHNHSFLLSPFADDSIFFLEDISSIKLLVETFKEFSHFSELKRIIRKSKIASLGPMKGVPEAFCGLKPMDLVNDAIKKTGIPFPYHFVRQRNFLSTIKNIQKALNVWNKRTLALEGRILIRKLYIYL